MLLRLLLWARISVELRPVSVQEGKSLPNYDVNVLPTVEAGEQVTEWLRAETVAAYGNSSKTLQEIADAVFCGIDDGLCNGPMYGYPVSGVEVVIDPNSLSISMAGEGDAGKLLAVSVGSVTRMFCVNGKLYICV